MTEPYTSLRTDPLPSPALDYKALRDEGLRLLQRFASGRWSDFNAHDPGVTILELLCYALTDLGYRIHHPMADLLARRKADDLPGPAAILTCDPVTDADVRKLALGVEGVANAWLEGVDEPFPLYYHAGRRELRFESEQPDAPPVRSTGVRRVRVEALVPDQADDVLQKVSAALHAHRPLGQDYEVALAPTQTIGLWAEVEIEAVEDSVGLMADIIARIKSYLAPSARFDTLAETQARGLPIDEVFEGPRPERGFLVHLPARRDVLYVSDLVRLIMDVRGVRAIPRIELASSPHAERQRRVLALALEPGHVARAPELTAPRTSEGGCGIVLLRNGRPLVVSPKAVDRRLDALASTRGAAGDMRALEPPAGRDRALSAYRSILRHLPAAYGLRPLGLPAGASAQRRAQALQLEAYLHVFDQLLANLFAQLDHVHELFSVEPRSTGTYFTQLVRDLPAEDRRFSVLASAPEEHLKWLEQQVEAASTRERGARFVSHLLARFAEDIGPGVEGAEPKVEGDGGTGSDRDLARWRALLAGYPRLSGGRGSGMDLRAQRDTPSPFAERLRLKLGLSDPRGFIVVEHVLLRPLPEDVHQRGESDEGGVLLVGVDAADPRSNSLSIVFKQPSGEAGGRGEEEGSERERWVADTVVGELPAHLWPHLLWFDQDAFATFENAWEVFMEAWTTYQEKGRAKPHEQGAPGPGPRGAALEVRAARDRVLDLLCFEDGAKIVPVLGQTYPLRDVPVSATPSTVRLGASAELLLAFSQHDVTYELYEMLRNGNGQPVPGARAAGTGGALRFETPALQAPASYRVLAWKTADQRRLTWLGPVHVTVE